MNENNIECICAKCDKQKISNYNTHKWFEVNRFFNLGIIKICQICDLEFSAIKIKTC